MSVRAEGDRANSSGKKKKNGIVCRLLFSRSSVSVLPRFIHQGLPPQWNLCSFLPGRWFPVLRASYFLPIQRIWISTPASKKQFSTGAAAKLVQKKRLAQCSGSLCLRMAAAPRVSLYAISRPPNDHGGVQYRDVFSHILVARVLNVQGS